MYNGDISEATQRLLISWRSDRIKQYGGIHRAAKDTLQKNGFYDMDTYW